MAVTIGRRFVDLLPSSLKESVGFYIAPLLGLACMVLITTLYGWLSPFKSIVTIPLVMGVILICIKFEKNRIELVRECLVISAFAIVATLPILAPAIRFDSYNPFNDTFTYLVQGQWLQEHSFSEAARASGFFPAETQVFLYQSAGSRMGGSFFLGFVQSLFNLEWSYYAYLATVGFVFSIGSLALGGIIRQVVPVSRAVTLALCTLPAFTMNGFVFGAQFGFFPQTFGLTFAAGLACLMPGIITNALSEKPTWSKQFVYLIPLTLCFSAFLLAYNDMFPIVGVVISIFLICVSWMYWSEKKIIAVLVLIFTAQVIAVVNVEGLRLVYSIINTALNAADGTARFGWQVLWMPVQFGAFSFGMKLPFSMGNLGADTFISVWMFLLLLIAVIFVIAKIFRAKPRNLTVLFILCLNLVFALAFLKFRYATPSLNGEVGFTFLQFKLAQWLALFNLGLLGISIAWLFVKLKGSRRIYLYSCYLAYFVIFLAGYITQCGLIADNQIQSMQKETMRNRMPFNVFLELRAALANIPKDDVVYLGIPNEHHKMTQMVAYVLYDRKLSGDYQDDYMGTHIPKEERNMSPRNAKWYIEYKPQAESGENALRRVGPFLIHRAPFSFFILNSIKGAYGTEVTKDKKIRNWVNDKVEYSFVNMGKLRNVKIKFLFLAQGQGRTLTMELIAKSGESIAVNSVAMGAGWGEYESSLIETKGKDFTVQFTADGIPKRLSAADSRKAKFLIQNLTIE